VETEADWPPSVIEEAWFVREPLGIHGIGHVTRVRTHALALAREMGADSVTTRAIERACAWHDIGRVNDDVDPSHGQRSVGRTVQLGLHEGEPIEVVRCALFAVRWHSVEDRAGLEAARAAPDPDTAEFVFSILKDADGLDRVRINDLDPRHLRFGASRDRVDEAYRIFAEWTGPGR
jgi:HD superfamily phosphodiesterase